MLVGKIKEVSSVAAPAKLEHRHANGFPSTSLFSMRNKVSQSKVISPPLDADRTSKSMPKSVNVNSNNSNITNDTGQMDYISSMSEEERIAAIESISSIISPSNLEFLRNRPLKALSLSDIDAPSRLDNVVHTNITRSTDDDSDIHSGTNNRNEVEIIETHTSTHKLKDIGSISPSSISSLPLPLPVVNNNNSIPIATSTLFKSKSNRFDLDGRRLIICTNTEDLLYTELYTAFFPIATVNLLNTKAKRGISELMDINKNINNLNSINMNQLQNQLLLWNENQKKQLIELIIKETEMFYNRGSVLDNETGGYEMSPVVQKSIHVSDERELYNHERDPTLPGYTMDDISEVRYNWFCWWIFLY